MAKRYDNFLSWRHKYPASLTLDKYESEGIITEDDRLLIMGYVDHRRAVAESLGWRRAEHLPIILAYWRRYLKVPYRTASIGDVRMAVSGFKGALNIKGRPYSQNSRHDYISILKSFLYWMIDEKISTLEPRLVREIKTPAINKHTTEPHERLRAEDVRSMLEKTSNPMHRAFIVVSWESGGRPEEVVSLQWRDLVGDEYGYRLWLTDFKKNTRRFVRLTMAAPYLSEWRSATRHGGDEDLIFVTQRGGGMAYKTAAWIVADAAGRAGIKKRVRLYGFRKGRINNMVEDGYPNAAILAQIWDNQDSRMLGTYLSQSETDIDRMLLEHQGLLKDEAKKPDPLASITCTFCHERNKSVARFCSSCGRPVSGDAAVLQKSLSLHFEEESRNDPSYLLETFQRAQEIVREDLARRQQGKK